MTKKEQKELDDLRESLYIAKAFRFTDKVLPDIAIPKSSGEVDETNGFSMNDYLNTMSIRDRVYPEWSTSVSHGSPPRTKYNGIRGGIELYSTKLLALRALRHSLELQCAKLLASIDKQIDQELNQ